MKAIDTLRPNLRELRARMIADQFMRRIEPVLDTIEDGLLCRHISREVQHVIFETLAEIGANLVTDEDRTRAGLPPRGPDGWTHEELAALEQLRLDTIYKAMSPVVVVPTDKG